MYKRQESTLSHYVHRVGRIKEGSYTLAEDARPLLPNGDEDAELFEYKLRTMAGVFKQLVEE